MTSGHPRPQVDTGKPHSARIYDFLLGGKDNYLVDRQVAEQLADEAKLGARQNRAFMHRAVDWVARQGVDQFLDIGTGIPTEPNVHQIAQKVCPTARIVYTDNDPIVLRHAEALLISAPGGLTDYIEADVREPHTILDHARASLDFTRPVALSLIALMHFVTDDQDPYGITRTLLAALPAGSYLILTHGTEDFMSDEQKADVAGRYRSSGIRLRNRNRQEVEEFFAGLDLVEPGVIRASGWHKDTTAPRRGASFDLVYAGVARIR